ncbi:NAD+ synthase, partial [Candidatus Marinamargulisbacteria bacterium SCGC AG-343-D04]
EKDTDLVVFSECMLTGYPPRDLLTYDAFIKRVQEAITELQEWSKSMPEVGILFGTPLYKNEELYNTACLLYNGRVQFQQSKTNLPNYDVFDENRYFSTVDSVDVLNFKGIVIGITICEDAWIKTSLPKSSLHHYQQDPIKECVDKGAQCIINLSASPFEKGKQGQRQTLFSYHAKRYKVPMIVVNQVGANDQLIFDGASFVIDSQGELCEQLASFEEDKKTIQLDALRPKKLPQITDIESVYHALVLGIRDYVRKTGFNKVCIGLSGGIDSALVCALAVAALGKENVIGVSMPSDISSEGSKSDALALARNCGIEFHTLPIHSPVDSIEKIVEDPFKGLDRDETEENIQSRIRGILLMAFSNKFKSLVLTTGNKSELAMGYCTLYGDMCGALSVLADVPKTLVYDLARYINKDNESIPENSISKAPSAELRPGQIDADSLPPYDVLDRIVHGYIEEFKSAEDIINDGLDKEIVYDVIRKIDLNEYKRKQAPTPLKITSKSFGCGRRLPIARHYFMP